MPNEVLLILTVIVEFSMVVLWFRLFGSRGLMALMAVFTVLANIEVLILVNAFGLEQTLGNVLFAATFLITDIISETSGKQEAKRAANIGILAGLCFVVISSSWLLYTPAAGDRVFDGIKAVFSGTPRVVIAGLAVYAVCQRLDVWLYHRFWEMTEKKYGDRSVKMYLRNNCATLICQLVNTVLFNLAAFAGVYDWKTLLSIIGAGYIIFVITSLADTPFLYWARRIHRKSEAKRNEQ